MAFLPHLGRGTLQVEIMKMAITGKGGVGKSTLAGILASLARDDGKTVLAVDSDPDANLAFALGMPEQERARIVPVAQRSELIEERTGAKLKQFGQIFKLNPDISDVTDRFSYDFNGIHLLVLGAIEAGGTGCACPENVFLRNLLSNIILQRGEIVIVDMEPGFEHLGRSTAQGVDLMVVVVEPASQSVATARAIVTLAEQIGLRKIRFVGNKITSKSERAYLADHLEAGQVMGFIPYSESIRQADRDGILLLENLDSAVRQAFEAIYRQVATFQER
jgi:CO dehydrogenase maturation factor